MGHMKFSPSGAHRWLRCPGSIRECSGVEDKPSVYSAEGTAAHDIAATCLEDGLAAEEFVNHEVSADGFDFVCDAEMVEHIQTYLDVVRGLKAGMLWVEEEVKHGLWKGVGGTADAIVLSKGGTELHVIDLKYGAGRWVDVKENSQLMIYAICALRSLADECSDVGLVHMHVVQPRHHKGGHSTFTMTRKELEEWNKTVLGDGVKAAARKDAPLIPGETQCQWCDVRETCSALRESVLEETRELFADEPPEPGMLTPDHIADLMSQFPMWRLFMKAVEEHAYKLATTGTELPSYKLVQRSSNRKWRDPEEVKGYLELLGVDPYNKPTLITPAEAERRAPKKRKAALAKLCFKPEAAPALVHVDEGGDDYNPADGFTPVKETEKNG